MLRAALVLALGFAIVTLATSTDTARADEKKPDEKKDGTKKLEGKLTCTKCSLGESDKCGHALVVKVGDKEVKYYLNDKGNKETYHGNCCSDPVDAIVTGKVVEKEKKLYIDMPKVEIKK